MNHWRSSIAVWAVAGTACLLLAATAAQADPKNRYKQEMEGKGRGRGSEHRHQEKGAGHRARGGSHRYEVEYVGKGPPPWAVAHGRRSEQETVQSTAYVVPHRIDEGRCNRATVGAVVGGTAGGVLGSTIGGGAGRAAAVIAGTVLGAVVGGEIGRWMDAVDQACAAQTLEYAGTSRNVEWVNPDNGAVYQITPTETYRTAEDRYCREYRTEADIGGRKHEVYGTACRQPDGSWQLVHE